MALPLDQALLDEYLTFAQTVAKSVGSIIREAFYCDKSVETKACVTDLVTDTDKKVENFIIEKVRSTYPDHEFIGEESVAEGKHCVLTDLPTWVVDPIDGTTNFVHKFPYVAVCIGLVLNKKPVLGVVYNPILNEMYTAKQDGGAFLNGNKITVSKQSNLHESLVMTECGSSRDPGHLDKVFTNLRAVLSAPVHAIHSLGSAALNMCMVANGSAEAYYEFGIHCWDYCAASVIVQEAGGVVVDTTGGPLELMRRRVNAACNMNIAVSLSGVLKEQMELPRD